MDYERVDTDRTPPQREVLPRMGAGCLVLIGLAILALAIVPMTARGGFDLSVAVFYALAGSGFGISGIFWYRYIGTMERVRREHFAEKAILQAAARNGGLLTLAQITLQTPLTAADAGVALELLASQGIARPELRDDGTVEYRFNGLLPP